MQLRARKLYSRLSTSIFATIAGSISSLKKRAIATTRSRHLNLRRHFELACVLHNRGCVIAWRSRSRRSALTARAFVRGVFDEPDAGALGARELSELMVRARRGDAAERRKRTTGGVRSGASGAPSISGFRDLEIAAAAEVLANGRSGREARSLIRGVRFDESDRVADWSRIERQ